MQTAKDAKALVSRLRADGTIGTLFGLFIAALMLVAGDEKR